jgi:hypothetical protein
LSIIEFDQPLDWITFDLSIKTYYKVILWRDDQIVKNVGKYVPSS